MKWALAAGILGWLGWTGYWNWRGHRLMDNYLDWRPSWDESTTGYVALEASWFSENAPEGWVFETAVLQVDGRLVVTFAPE